MSLAPWQIVSMQQGPMEGAAAARSSGASFQDVFDFNMAGGWGGTAEAKAQYVRDLQSAYDRAGMLISPVGLGPSMNLASTLGSIGGIVGAVPIPGAGVVGGVLGAIGSAFGSNKPKPPVPTGAPTLPGILGGGVKPSWLGGEGTPAEIPGTTMVPVKNKAGNVIYELIISPAGRVIAYYAFSRVKGWVLHHGQPHRRMNPFNPHALARADRRVKAFGSRAGSVLKHLGFHVSKTRHTKVKIKARRRK